MARLVSILILEEGVHEIVEPEFIRSIETSGEFKVLQFNKVDTLNSAEEKKG